MVPSYLLAFPPLFISILLFVRDFDSTLFLREAPLPSDQRSRRLLHRGGAPAQLFWPRHHLRQRQPSSRRHAPYYSFHITKFFPILRHILSFSHLVLFSVVSACWDSAIRFLLTPDFPRFHPQAFPRRIRGRDRSQAHLHVRHPLALRSLPGRLLEGPHGRQARPQAPQRRRCCVRHLLIFLRCLLSILTPLSYHLPTVPPGHQFQARLRPDVVMPAPVLNAADITRRRAFALGQLLRLSTLLLPSLTSPPSRCRQPHGAAFCRRSPWSPPSQPPQHAPHPGRSYGALRSPWRLLWSVSPAPARSPQRVALRPLP